MSNPKRQMISKLTHSLGVWKEIGRADEYPREADGSQTTSEFCREYTHIVDDLKPWSYFDIPGCLKRLSWPVDGCYGRIRPQWATSGILRASSLLWDMRGNAAAAVVVRRLKAGTTPV
jgi:hypothetical protein